MAQWTTTTPLCPDWAFCQRANVHTAKDRDWFTTYTPFPTYVLPTLGPPQRVLGIGTVDIPISAFPSSTSSTTTLHLENVLHVPGLLCNILGFPLQENYRVAINGGVGGRDDDDDGSSDRGVISNKAGKRVGYFRGDGPLCILGIEAPAGRRLGAAVVTGGEGSNLMLSCEWPSSEAKRWQGIREEMESRETIASFRRGRSKTMDVVGEQREQREQIQQQGGPQSRMEMGRSKSVAHISRPGQGMKFGGERDRNTMYAALKKSKSQRTKREDEREREREKDRERERDAAYPFKGGDVFEDKAIQRVEPRREVRRGRESVYPLKPKDAKVKRKASQKTRRDDDYDDWDKKGERRKPERKKEIVREEDQEKGKELEKEDDKDEDDDDKDSPLPFKFEMMDTEKEYQKLKRDNEINRYSAFPTKPVSPVEETKYYDSEEEEKQREEERERDLAYPLKNEYTEAEKAFHKRERLGELFLGQHGLKMEKKEDRDKGRDILLDILRALMECDDKK